MPTNLLKEGHQIGWIVSTSKNIFCEWERKKKITPQHWFLENLSMAYFEFKQFMGMKKQGHNHYSLY